MMKSYISIIILFAFSLIISYLLFLEEYSILAVIIIVFLFIILTAINFRFLIYYYFLFGALTAPGLEKIGGLISLGWLRNALLLLLYFGYILFLFNNLYKLKKDENFKIYLFGIIPFILYISLTFIWSISPIDSFRYIPKYFLVVVLSLAVIADKKISVDKSLKLLLYGTVIFLIISVIAEIFKDPLGRSSEYFEGFSGRHQSKYYIVFIIILWLASIITKYNKSYFFSLTVISFSFVLLVLILQRGSFLALMFSLIYIYAYFIRKEKPLRTIILGFAILFFAFIMILLFQNPRFQEYTFTSQGVTIADFWDLIKRGDIARAFSLIAFKGRLEVWEASLELFKNRIIGQGLATTAVKMEEIVGQYLEIHNDPLQYLIEGGYLGFILYLIMWFNLFKISWRYRKNDDKLVKFISLSAGAYTAGLFAWSFVDHVLNYSPMNFCFLFVLLALLIKRVNDLKEK